jgi:hypothetical protein
MTDSRSCEQCGALFMPRREHARFCSARCRVAWGRENVTDPAAGVRALEWSVTAMRDATGRIRAARAWDQRRAFAVVGEAVWWVTIVDATLVRHHPDLYDGMLAGPATAERQLIEGTLAGLRFVRNRMGHYADHADLIQPGAAGPGAGQGRIAAWTWKQVPEPAVASLPPRGQEWEMTRYRAYEAHLAGQSVGEIFARPAAFLELTAAQATSDAEVREHAAR